jgi:hypothetical protein
MPSRLGRVLSFSLALCTVALALGIWGSARSAGVDLGCEGVRVEVNVDGLSLDDYQAFVRERRCKCLHIQSECVASPVVSRPSVSPQKEPSPIAPPAKQPPPLPPPPPNTRTFTIYDARDIGGSDYKTLRNRTQEFCIEQCKQDNKCVAFSWDRWNNYCFLKDAVPGIARIDPQSMAAVARTEMQPTDSRAPVVFEPFYNAEFRDRPYITTQESSYRDCERTCRDDNRCEVFTYRTASKSCNLIRRPYEYYRLGDRSAKYSAGDCTSRGLAVCSGVKRQRAP